MSDFERIKYYYDNNFWNKDQVGKAVEFNKITAAEYELIVGEPYQAPAA